MVDLRPCHIVLQLFLDFHNIEGSQIDHKFYSAPLYEGLFLSFLDLERSFTLCLTMSMGDQIVETVRISFSTLCWSCTYVFHKPRMVGCQKIEYQRCNCARAGFNPGRSDWRVEEYPPPLPRVQMWFYFYLTKRFLMTQKIKIWLKSTIKDLSTMTIHGRHLTFISTIIFWHQNYLNPNS